MVAISSIAGIRGSRIAPAYNASKAYQIKYLEGLRQKATKVKMPIYVTDIRPGFVDTDMAKGHGQFWVATKEKTSRQIFGIIQRKKEIGYETKLESLTRLWVLGFKAHCNRVYPDWSTATFNKSITMLTAAFNKGVRVFELAMNNPFEGLKIRNTPAHVSGVSIEENDRRSFTPD